MARRQLKNDAYDDVAWDLFGHHFNRCIDKPRGSACSCAKAALKPAIAEASTTVDSRAGQKRLKSRIYKVAVAHTADFCGAGARPRLRRA
jgi:hypothetical protein